MPRRAANPDIAALDLAIEDSKAAEQEVIKDFSYVSFVSTEPEPVGFYLGPNPAGRLAVGSKTLLWRVPPEDVENMKNHYFVTSGRIKILEE